MQQLTIRKRVPFVGLLTILTWTLALGAHADASQGPGDPDHAQFGNQELDLSRSWGAARVCVELGDRTECFRDDEEMEAAHPELAPPEPGGITPFATCSSSLRLYANNSYGGASLILTTRAVVFNLSTFGFNNVTSSYKVGACASEFWAGNGASGAAYPGPTGAGASATAMLPGWDNSVSSVLIY